MNEVAQEFEKRTLEMLNRHFRATPFEQYNDSVMSFLLTEARKKAMGAHQNAKVGKKAESRIYDNFLEGLRSRYGRHINVSLFRFKKNGFYEYVCNLGLAYKTDQGMLFGVPMDKKVGSDVFYTAHAFDRFEERANPEYVRIVRKALQQGDRVVPTAADIIMFSLGSYDFQYAKEQGGPYYHLDIGLGSLLLEDFGEFYVAKTFLSPPMIEPKLKWMIPLRTEEQRMNPLTSFETLREVFDLDSIPASQDTHGWTDFIPRFYS